MPHQHHRFHGIVRARDDDSPWAQFTKGAASAWNEVNPFQKEQSTIYKTVYTTQTPEGWDGKGGLTTLSPGAGSRQENTAAVQNAATTTSSSSTHTTKKSTTATAASTSASDILVQDTSLPASIIPTSASSVDSAIVIATNTPTPVGQTAQSTTASATPTTSAKAQESSGDNTAAKAGIVIGVLAGVFVVAAIVYFLFSRRRKQIEKQRLADDEKVNGPFGDHAAIPTTPSRAPRLSLRPVTQFLPNLNPHPHPDRRASRGAAIAMVASPNSSRAPGQSAWERPLPPVNANPANPFGDNAERLHTAIPEEPSTPLDSHSAGNVGVANTTYSPPGVSPISAVAGAGAVAGVVAGAGAVSGLTRKQSVRKDVPKPLDLTLPPPLSAVPPSPAGTEFSVSSLSPGQSPGPSASAAAIAAAGGPQTSAVHRVQLDFKPTLEDEMGLRAGQLVRLLHEYDDGWALCIRLDRSEQGVVPRTCLSTRPVKPRPANGGPRGPPVNPQRGPNYHPSGRPMTPQGGPGYPRPESPIRPMTAGRPQSPAGRPMSPYGTRPQSPAGGRPMSPGPRSQSPGPRYQQGRSESPNRMNRRMSPPGPSQMSQEYKPGPPTGPVGRKPVPGQAY